MTTLEHHSYGRALERRKVEKIMEENPAKGMGLGSLTDAYLRLVQSKPYLIEEGARGYRDSPWFDRYHEIIGELNRRFPAPKSSKITPELSERDRYQDD